MRNSSGATHGSWGRKARTFHVGEPVARGGGGAGALPSWRLTSGWGGRLDENPEEEGWERERAGGLRKGVAAGEKLETSAPLGSRMVQLSHSGGEAPCKLLSPPRTRPFVVGLCLWLPLMPSGPLPPLKSPQLHS